MKIEVFVRNVYGNPLIYPACDQAKKLAAFASCKVFSTTQIEQLRAAGIQVDQVPDPAAVLP
jgi:hypothetical protein